ncbi:hypothetical protein MMC30_008858 [Trapelia coarctata]|nr:hypothetical protein [Trapelia coarctata]
MESLRSLKAKELTPELQTRRRQQRHRRLAHYEESLVLLDPKTYQREDDLDGDKAIENVKDIAFLLHEFPAQFGTLKCKGWFEDEGQEQLYFVFFAPPGCSAGSNIVTLHDYLSQPFKPSLTARLRLACSLARTLQHIHEKGFYHKGIRSDCVIFFRRPSAERSLADPYMAGFDLSRKAELDKWSEKLL